MLEENAKELIIALANSAAEEYRELIALSKKSKNRDKEYYKLRAEETLAFFDDKLFITAFGEEKAKYIKEQLRKGE